MTHNVLTYLANKEQARTNLAKEQETYRSNLAKEAETQRSNLAKEQENIRYNTAYLQELNRSNVRKENISAFEAQEKQRANQAAEGINLLNARTRGLELAEERRHSQVLESQGAEKLNQGAEQVEQTWKSLSQQDQKLIIDELNAKFRGMDITFDFISRFLLTLGKVLL